jgi:broad specificity phosphatase PhoE
MNGMRRLSHWPASLTLVRHGESIGNVARVAAESAGHHLIDIAERDMDVPLSPRGEEQAAAVGRWLRTLPRTARPQVALSSPYRRACHTAEIALASGGLRIRVVLDERLREREFGVLDRLTKSGIIERFPDQAEARARVGKFYHRPPGGESWSDVTLRVRSVLDSITREYGGQHVMIVAHQVVILMFRYVIERMTEAEILALDRSNELANCSITSFRAVGRRGSRGMRLERFNELVALEETDAPVTAEPDVPVAPR